MAEFGQEAQSRVLVRRALQEDAAGTLECLVDKWIKYFRATFHRNTGYAVQFFFCELLNFVLLWVQFAETDKFLNGMFRSYGLQTLKYYNMPYLERRDDYNPLCATFPTEVSCNIPYVGAAGAPSSANGLCILTQNNINQKIYLMFWWWYIILGSISVAQLVFRLATLASPPLRLFLIYNKIRHQFDGELWHQLDSVLRKGQLGDWFVLYQLTKNSSRHFYREFIRGLDADLKQAPKWSLSNQAQAGQVTNGQTYSSPTSRPQSIKSTYSIPSPPASP